MASSSTTSTTNPPRKYDVFLSFRGEDTRYGFTNYLHDALKRKQILTFIDNELVRGDEISTSLLKAIEESKLSVIILSENYASSKWCLEELVKILECRKNNGQIVVPVFYLVDPSHVRNQTGSFGEAFARLIEEKALAMDKVQSFKCALKDAANLSGRGLEKFELESKFVEEISRDILKKLQKMSSNHTMGLVGIDARIKKIETLLNMESEDVPTVGVWGMGGIGKTTIAKAVCNNIRTQFEGIFFANFREELRTRPMADLQRSFLLQLLGQENLNMGPLSFRDSFTRDRLHRMKVLIVLDDVDNSMQLQEWRELICRQHFSFGLGSKILVTSRDKQLLKEMVGEECINEVEGLNHDEALQLFSLKAFMKNCSPTIDDKDLVERIVNYAQGNPLALIVLGSTLFGKSKEEWRSALDKLALDPRVENVLRISYDGLDTEQKSIVLDIAYFFRGWEQNHAARILDGMYGRSVLFDISMLIDKCLVTISQNKLGMHDLLQEMAFSIVRAESKNPGKRSRLCDVNDVVHVLKKKKGTDRIEGISLDMSKLSREMHLESDTFARMDCLRILNFYDHDLFTNKKDTVHLPHGGLEYLSDELRYLHWDGFPLKSLPQNFCAENLVELNFNGSKVERLWRGVQEVGNLRKIVLSYSPYLMELPDLSMAKNLVSLDLVGCSSLTEVPSSLQYLDKLEELYLYSCYNLRSFPMLDSKVLTALSISRCLDVTKCPTISENMKSLYLEETSIKEVPQSITNKLENLGLHGCSKITKFPDISGDIKELYLSGTAIKEVPSSILFLTKLHTLDMSGCSKLESFPEITVPMKSLWRLNLSKTGIREIPSSFKHMISLRCLELDGTPIKELPLSIKDMICLRHLALHGTPIKVLPELPPSLWSLTARDCASLETMISIVDFGRLWNGLNFANCFNLDRKPLIAQMHLKIQSGEIPYDGIQIILPGSEIPEWFGDKGVGSSLTIQLPSKCHQLKGIAFCLVFLLPLPSDDMPYEFDDHREVLIDFDCHVKSKNDQHDSDDEEVFIFKRNYNRFNFLKTCASDHMFLNYERILLNHFSKYSGNEVKFKFYPQVDNVRTKVGHQIRKLCKLKSCGVYLHFDENLPTDTSDEDSK